MGRLVEERWFVVTLPLAEGADRLLVVDALRRCGARLVEPEGGALIAYFPAPLAAGELLAEVREAVRATIRAPVPAPCWRWAAADELAARWRGEVTSRRVGKRMVVAVDDGSAEPLHEEDLVIRLEPGLAFGTAGHPTTRICLAFLEARVRRGDRIVDVGSGSGILAIAAALLGARRVLALEADSVACRAAERNVRASGVGDRVRVRHRVVGTRGVPPGLWRDGVIANIEAPILLPRIPILARSARPGAWIVLSGAARGDREAVLEAAVESGLRLERDATDEGWWGGVFRRRPAPWFGGFRGRGGPGR